MGTSKTQPGEVSNVIATVKLQLPDENRTVLETEINIGNIEESKSFCLEYVSAQDGGPLLRPANPPQ